MKIIRGDSAVNYDYIDLYVPPEFDFRSAYEQTDEDYPRWSLDDFDDLVELAADAE
jgi:hypothetical protein